MQLFRKTAVAIAAVAAIGCRDTSAPLQPMQYGLIAVDGRPLPTFISPIPEGPTVLSGTFVLDGGSHASANELRRDMSGNEYTFEARYRYTVSGNVIQFDFDPPCEAPLLCKSRPTGTISGDDLLIDYSGGNNTPIYDYRHFRMIDLPPG